MNNKQVMDKITKEIISKLETGVIPWHKPWSGMHAAYSRATGKPYSLLNQFYLDEGEYATFKQIRDEGGKVKKGEHGSPVVFWKIYQKTKTDDEGNEIVVNIPVLKYYTVFNVEKQTTLKRKHKKLAGASLINDLEAVKEGYISRTGVKYIETAGDRAYYAPLLDKVVLPLREQFNDTNEYYSTMMHEFAHSTGHPDRLNRGLGDKVAFGSEDYSREELVAEISAAGILASAGYDTESTIKSTAAYVQSWIQALKNDTGMIVWAASRAEKAMAMILDN